jgi:hypothetical protein
VALVVVALVVPPMKPWDRLAWRADFGTWTATPQPPRVDFCGCRFYPPADNHGTDYPGPATLTLAEVEAQGI